MAAARPRCLLGPLFGPLVVGEACIYVYGGEWEGAASTSVQRSVQVYKATSTPSQAVFLLLPAVSAFNALLAPTYLFPSACVFVCVVFADSHSLVQLLVFECAVHRAHRSACQLRMFLEKK